MASQLFGLPCTLARNGMRARPSWSGPNESPVEMAAYLDIQAAVFDAVLFSCDDAQMSKILLYCSRLPRFIASRLCRRHSLMSCGLRQALGG